MGFGSAPLRRAVVVVVAVVEEKQARRRVHLPRSIRLALGNHMLPGGGPGVVTVLLEQDQWLSFWLSTGKKCDPRPVFPRPKNPRHSLNRSDAKPLERRSAGSRCRSGHARRACGHDWRRGVWQWRVATRTDELMSHDGCPSSAC